MVGFRSKPPGAWSTREVWEFLSSIDGERFTQAASCCLQNSVDGKTLLRLSRTDLENALGLHVLQASRVLAELGGISDAGSASSCATVQPPQAGEAPLFNTAAPLTSPQMDGPVDPQVTSPPKPSGARFRCKSIPRSLSPAPQL
jgi:hypothetical protein